jgi:hypothetical protein
MDTLSSFVIFFTTDSKESFATDYRLQRQCEMAQGTPLDGPLDEDAASMKVTRKKYKY